MTQTLLQFDTAPHNGTPTSRAAAESIEPHLGRLQSLVLAYIARHPDGVTDEEIARDLDLNPSCARPRRIELLRKGLIRDTGRTRPTSSGRAAAIWRVV